MRSTSTRPKPPGSSGSSLWRPFHSKPAPGFVTAAPTPASDSTTLTATPRGRSAPSPWRTALVTSSVSISRTGWRSCSESESSAAEKRVPCLGRGQWTRAKVETEHPAGSRRERGYRSRGLILGRMAPSWASAWRWGAAGRRQRDSAGARASRSATVGRKRPMRAADPATHVAVAFRDKRPVVLGTYQCMRSAAFALRAASFPCPHQQASARCPPLVARTRIVPLGRDPSPR